MDLRALLIIFIAIGALTGLNFLIEKIEGINIFKKLNVKQIRLLITSIWILSAVVLIAPGGVISQIGIAGDRLKTTLETSPTGHICYTCGKAASHSATYGSGNVLYFCDKHWPPPRTVSATARASKGLNPTFALIVVLSLYGINYLRVFIHLLSSGKKFKPSLKGALWGFLGSFILVVWFATR